MRRLLTLALALVLCLSLAGCLEPENDAPEDFWEIESPVETEPEPESAPEVLTLPYLSSQPLNPVSCSDGAQQAVASLLYEGLFTLDESFTPQNALCVSYVRSTNGKTYTFTLREDVTFTDGTALTPADVIAAYRRAQVSDRYAARFENITGMRAGRGTVILTLARADSALPALLDIPVFKSGTDKYTAPIGTGPYRFVSDESGEYLARNESWWNDGSGLPDRIALVAAKDADTSVYLFTAGKAHLLTADLLGETPAASVGGTEITDAPTTTMYYLAFNATKKMPTADKTLRVAMNAALDRDAIVTSLLADHARSAQFPISPVSPLYPAELETTYTAGSYGEALAARSSGNAAPLELRLIVNEENSFKAALAEHIARALSQSYVTVTPVVLSWADYLVALNEKDFDLYLGEVRLTADWNITSLVGTNGALNYGGFTDASTDTALAAFLAKETTATAAALCARLAEEAPILPVAFKSLSVLTPAGKINGVSPTQTHPLNRLEAWTFRFNEQ